MSQHMADAMESKYLTAEDLDAETGTGTYKAVSSDWSEKEITLKDGTDKTIWVLTIGVNVKGKTKLHECNLTETRLVGRSGTNGVDNGDDELVGKRVRFGLEIIKQGPSKGKGVPRVNKVL